MGAAIEFEFKGNLAQLKRDLGEASRLAKASAADVSRTTRTGFDGGIAGAFRRTPERRAERALGALGTGLLTGDIGAAIGGFTEKITAFGLAAGAGVAVAIGVFEKLRRAITETDNAFGSLRSGLNRPLATQLALGPEGISNQIADHTKALEAAIAARNKLGGRAAESTIEGTSDARFGSGVRPGANAAAAAHNKAIEEAEQRIAQLSAGRAEAELKIANLKLQAAQGYEKEAALAKITLDAEEKRAALLLSRGGNSLDLFKSNLAIGVEAEAARLQIEKKFETPFEPGPLRVGTDPVPGGRKAGIGESQELVNQIELNRQGRNSSSLGLPWHYNPDTGVSSIDQLGFKRTENTPVPPSEATQSASDSKWDNIGTGIDGIKSGIDVMLQKMDKYWS